MERKLLFLALICSLVLSIGIKKTSAMSDQELRIRALEEKIDFLQPKSVNGKSYDAHGKKNRVLKTLIIIKKVSILSPRMEISQPTCNGELK